MATSEKLPRLIEELSLIGRSCGASVIELSRRFSVTKRTIYRDLDVLSQGGVPLHQDPDTHTYKLLTKTAIRPMTLTLDEASVLFHCVEGLCSANQPLRTLLRQAQDKLLDAVAPDLQQEFKSRPKVVDIQLISRLVSCDPKVYEPIYDAIVSRRRIHLHYYAKSHNETKERNFDPYIITWRGHAWYVIGFCHLEQDLKILRLDRISQVTVLDAPFEIPESFSLETFFAGSWNIEQGKLTHVKLKASPEAAHLLRAETYHSSQQLEDLPDGSLLFSVTVQGTREISRFILGFGEGIEVLAPLSLRKHIREQARKILAKNG